METPVVDKTIRRWLFGISLIALLPGIVFLLCCYYDFLFVVLCVLHNEFVVTSCILLVVVYSPRFVVVFVCLCCAHSYSLGNKSCRPGHRRKTQRKKAGAPPQHK